MKWYLSDVCAVLYCTKNERICIKFSMFTYLCFSTFLVSVGSALKKKHLKITKIQTKIIHSINFDKMKPLMTKPKVSTIMSPKITTWNLSIKKKNRPVKWNTSFKENNEQPNLPKSPLDFVQILVKISTIITQCSGLGNDKVALFSDANYNFQFD